MCIDAKIFLSWILGSLPFAIFAISGWCMAVNTQEPAIARWSQNKKAAVSLRFDDNLESHVNDAIPLLNDHAIRATFMVNPGRSTFKEHEHFWCYSVPAMGHELGNHTMHHHGARSIEEARYEIGEPAKYIRAINPRKGPLLVFASGGGEKWGGKHWEEADPLYKELVKEYQLIDLYDGKHPAYGADSTTTADDLYLQVQTAIAEGKHQAFSFHQIGSPRIKDFIYYMLKGRTMSFSKGEFQRFLDKLRNASSEVWIAPLGEILKYQEEYNNARILNIKKDGSGISFQLKVGTTPILFDMPLTIVFPGIKTDKFSAYQDNTLLDSQSNGKDEVLVTVQPRTSVISFNIKNGKR